MIDAYERREVRSSSALTYTRLRAWSRMLGVVVIVAFPNPLTSLRALRS